MAPLPKPFDVEAHFLRRQLLLKGQRDAVRKRVNEILTEGRTRPDIQALADELDQKGRGRPATGAKYQWLEMGEMNDEMKEQGLPYKERLHRLSLRFQISDVSKIKTYLKKYKDAREEYLGSIDDR